MKRMLFHTLLLLLPVLFLGACKEEEQPKSSGNKKSYPEEVTPSPGGGSSSTPTILQVATYNILKPSGSGRRDEMSLDREEVKEALYWSILGTGAAIVAFNELDQTCIPGGDYALDRICKDLPGKWGWKTAWPNKINAYPPLSYSYANGFAYNQNLVSLKESGYVWLSKTQNTWYTSSTEAYGKAGSPERTCIWARFLVNSTQREFWLFVTHLPTEKQGGALNMATVVNRFAADKAGKAPAILCGDMNFGPGKDPYERLCTYWSDGNAKSTQGTLSGSSDDYYYTVQTFSENHPERRIDHILTHGCTASGYSLVPVTYSLKGKAWCPSDHLPVTATITIP